MGIVAAVLSAIFGDSKEMINAEIIKLQNEKIQRYAEFRLRLDEVMQRSKIADQYLTGWDLNFFMMRLADPSEARNVFEDAISELEEAKYIDPKIHLGVGMALTYYASQILVKDDALVYLKKIVEAYQKAVNDAPENWYYRSCLEYATRELAICTKEETSKDLATEHHPKLLKASTQDGANEHHLKLMKSLTQSSKINWKYGIYASSIVALAIAFRIKMSRLSVKS